MSDTLERARETRFASHGTRLTLHSVIYPLDYCKSSCSYCGLSQLLAREKAHGVRGGMAPATFANLVEGLRDVGYGVHELVFGTVRDDQRQLADQVARWVDRLRAIDRDAYVIVNCDTLQPEGYRRLRDAGTDAVWTFMEVMTPELYRRKHRGGLKAGQEQRLEAPLRIRGAGLAVGNALLWGLVPDWKAELDQFVAWAASVGGFDFVATPVQQAITLPVGTRAPDDFDVLPPLRIDPDSYLEIVSHLRLAFPETHLVGNTRLSPDVVYGRAAEIVDMCNGYVWTGARSHPATGFVPAGPVRSETTQMDFFNPGVDLDGIRALLPAGVTLSMSLEREPR